MLICLYCRLSAICGISMDVDPSKSAIVRETFITLK